MSFIHPIIPVDQKFCPGYSGHIPGFKDVSGETFGSATSRISPVTPRYITTAGSESFNSSIGSSSPSPTKLQSYLLPVELYDEVEAKGVRGYTGKLSGIIDQYGVNDATLQRLSTAATESFRERNTTTREMSNTLGRQRSLEQLPSYSPTKEERSIKAAVGYSGHIPGIDKFGISKGMLAATISQTEMQEISTRKVTRSSYE